MYIFCFELLFEKWGAFMKKFIPYFILTTLGIFLFYYAQSTSENVYYIDGNVEKIPLQVEEIKKDKSIICSDCGMMVKNPLTSAQAIIPSGRTYFFDDVGCMIRWVDQQSLKDKIKMYVYVPECSCYIDPFAAWYVRDGITPIGYGVVAYGTSMSAFLSDYTMSAYEFGYEKFKEKEKDKQIYEFEEVREYVLRGETLLHPIMKKLILQ